MWDGVKDTQDRVRVWVWGVVFVGWAEGHSGGRRGGGGGGSVGWAEGRGKERGVTTTNPHPSLPTVLSRYTEQYQHPEINRFIPVVAELALEEAVYLSLIHI